MPPEPLAPSRPPDDYFVDGADEGVRVGFVGQLLRVLRILVLIVLALASFGLFWVLATLLGLR